MNDKVYEIKSPKKINTEILARTAVPGSKSITNRALLLAAMSDGISTVNGCLTSEDAEHFLNCLKTLGFEVTEASDGAFGSNITIKGLGGGIPRREAEIYVGSAGTAARFLAAMLAFSDGEYVLNSSEQMKKRPMLPLIDTLRSAGAEIVCMEEEGYFPLKIRGSGRKNIPGSLTVNIEKSSQFLSALLIAAGTFGKNTEIIVKGSHGLSYADLTVKMMKSFGVSAEKSENSGQIRYLISGGCYRSTNYSVEPDMSAAAYFYALAAVLGAKVSVKGITADMLQGDTAFFDVLKRMGCELSGNDEIVLSGPLDGHLKGGFPVDMSAFSDQSLTLAAIAPFADAPVTITGIGHIRLQECDRIKAIVDNLTALGIKVEEKQDSVTVYPGIPKSGVINTYGDHRVAMSFALTGLRTEGVKISDPDCCKKTFAQYFEVLEQVLAQLG